MVETLSLAIETSRVKRGGDDFVRAERKISGSTRKIDKSVDRTDRKLKRLGKTSSTAGGLMARALGAVALTAGVRSGVRTFAQYEQSIAVIRGVLSGQIDDQELLGQSMKSIEKTARTLGATTRFSAAEAADGLLFLTRAGFDANQAIEAIPATLNLAQVGMIELGEAADFASNIVTGFGLAANQTERVVDVMVNTSNRANTDVRQLAEAMKFVAPIAGALGISVEETSAAIGVLGNSGIQASMAGTNLRGSLIKLLSPSGDAKEAMKNLHLEMQDLDPSVHGLIDAFEKLAAKNLDAKAASDIFMARNTAAGLTLTKNVETMKELNEANEKAGGSAESFAKIMDDTLIGSFKSLLSAVQELILQVGEGGVGGALRTVIDTTTSAVRILAGMEATVTENRKAAFLLAAALKGIAIAAGVFIALKLTLVFSGILASVAALPAAIAAVSASLVPLAATLAGIAIAATSFEMGRYFFDEFKIVQQTMAEVIAFFDRQWNGLKAAWKLLLADLIDLFSTDFVKKLTDLVADAVSGAAGLLEIFIPGIQSQVDGAVAGITASLQAAGNVTDKMRKDILDDYADDMKFTELVLGNTLDSIEQEFGSRDRKGANFAEFVKGDLEKAKNEMLNFIDDLATQAENAFTSATSGDESEGQMGPFLPDDIKAARNAVAALDLAMGLLGETTEETTDATADLEDKYGEWIEQLEETRTAMQLEIALLEGMTDRERILAEAKQRGLELTDAQINKIAQMEADLIVMDEQIERAEQMKQLYEDIGNEVAGAFTDVVFGAQSAEDAIEGMVKNITRLIFEMLVTQQIANAISGALGSAFGFGTNNSGGTTNRALGGVHSGLTPAASGLVMAPTRFTDGGGRNILAGEAGTEAIVPLARDSQGRLGIRDSGGGGRGGNTTVNIHIQTRDARSFQSRESQKQIQRSLRRTLENTNALPGG